MARSGKDEWRLLELERQQKREKQKVAENGKETGGRVGVVAMGETTRERRPVEGRAITRDREDGNLRMLYDSEKAETQGLEASMKANTGRESTTPPLNESSTP